MKVRMKLLPLALLSIILLVGCGTSEDKNHTAGSSPNKDKQEDIREKEKEDQRKEIDDESETDNSDTAKETEDVEGKTESEKVRILEQNLTYQVSNGDAKEETAFLKESDIQDYSLFILPEYEFTGEEPGKDVVYYKANGHHFMRIEVLPGETNLDEAITTIKEQLKTVNDTVSELDIKEGYNWLNDAKIFEAENKEDKISAYLFKKDGSLIKLMIFSKVSEDHEDPFLKMAETIELK